MLDFVVLGTDTDAGKTTFAALFLARIGDRYSYWKPVETGESDTERVRRWVPHTIVHEPLVRFDAPVAPPLAARLEGRTIPEAAAIAVARPASSPLLIETFGGPFSPLTDAVLQIDLVRKLGLPSVLVSSSALGAIGRTLQCLHAMKTHGESPTAIILMGPADPFAGEQLERNCPTIPVFSLQSPNQWDESGFAEAANAQGETLDAIASRIAANQSVRHGPTQRLLDLDRRHVWHPYSPLQSSRPPLVCVGAKDEFLELADGRRVIDAISSWWTILHGHRPPFLVAALQEALQRIDHVHFAGVTHPDAVELADLLLQSLGWTEGRVFYSDNGSTAVEVALKMAFQYWRIRGETRDCFIGFRHGYHGDTFGAMAVSRDPVFFAGFEPLLCRAEIVELDPQRLDDALKSRKGQIAAVIVEPLVQAAGGMRMHSPETLRALFEVSRANDTLFIVDEVMTGGGRSGPLWAHHAAGIRPDFVCAAKTLAGGMMPLAATMVAAHVAKAWENSDRSRAFFHGHSFTAHPLACAVAAVNYRHLLKHPPEAGRRMETFWRQALTPLEGHPRVREVRIVGTIAAVEFDLQGGYLASGLSVAVEAEVDHGVLLRPLGNVLYALPPYCAGEESLERIAQAIRRISGLAGAVSSCE